MLSASRAGHSGARHPKGEQANEGHTGPSSRDWGLTQQSLTEWEKERPLWDMCLLSEFLTHPPHLNSPSSRHSVLIPHRRDLPDAPGSGHGGLQFSCPTAHAVPKQHPGSGSEARDMTAAPPAAQPETRAVTPALRWSMVRLGKVPRCLGLLSGRAALGVPSIV